MRQAQLPVQSSPLINAELRSTKKSFDPAVCAIYISKLVSSSVDPLPEEEVNRVVKGLRLLVLGVMLGLQFLTLRSSDGGHHGSQFITAPQGGRVLLQNSIMPSHGASALAQVGPVQLKAISGHCQPGSKQRFPQITNSDDDLKN